ncbi:MAG: nitroreductase family protein [Chloroflexota bacterium]
MSHPKIATPDYPIHELLQKRWSPRAFAPKPLETETICSLLEAARWSASSNNLQPWSFIVATQAQEENFARMVECLMPGNATWASKAPVLMVSVAHMINPRRNAPNAHAYHDVGLAVQNLVTQAIALDIYVHQMGGFSRDKARELFQIPADYEAVSMLAVGYLGDPASLPEDRQGAEAAPRERKPLSEFVYSGIWGDVSNLVE